MWPILQSAFNAEYMEIFWIAWYHTYLKLGKKRRSYVVANKVVISNKPAVMNNPFKDRSYFLG
jgi:hypothetical protein